jgi:hypothetical protein
MVYPKKQPGKILGQTCTEIGKSMEIPVLITTPSLIRENSHGFCGFLDQVEDPQASISTPRTGSLASLASCKRLATLLALPASQAFS